jgi:hypothetical protein
MNKKYIVGVVVVVFVLLGLTALKLYVFDDAKVSFVEHKDKKEDTRELATTLSGQKVEIENISERPFAVVVENHPDARPQSGLSKAEIVYETVAEGGITRFLSVFQQPVEKIGPIRSARQYFAEIADGFGAVFTHVGGSPEALENITAGKFPHLLDLNEFYHGDFFERIKSRQAPHNAYTSTEKIESYLLSKRESLKSVDSSVLQGLVFVDQKDLNNSPSSEALNTTDSDIKIDFSKPSFFVEFKYDTVAKNYKRFIAGQADIDDLNQLQISPTTVIIQKTDMAPVVGDKDGRMKIRTTGEGGATIYSAGRKIEAKWKRLDGGKFSYESLDGSEIKILPGQIWVGIVAN